MKKSRLILVIALLAGALLVLPGLSADKNEEQAVAQETEQTENQTPEQPESAENNEEPEASADAYAYVAQEGDSYSVLARKAIQTYGIINEVNLSGAEIVYAETNLTRTAGSPELNSGQDVTITVDEVRQWVEAAQGLTDAEESNWEYYVQFVDFNTDAAGEARS